MTPTEREQQAREFWRECAGDLPVKDEVIERTVKLMADTERATLERVYQFVMNYHMTKMTTTAKGALRTVTDIEDWCRQQAKEIPS